MVKLTAKQRDALERAAAHPEGRVTDTHIATRRRLLESGLIADTGTEHQITARGRLALEPATEPDRRDVTWRQVENFAPGQWFRFEFQDGAGRLTGEAVWAEVRLVMHMEQRGTGRKFLRIRGISTTGEGVELVADRGQQVPNVTAAQARKVGLTVPGPDASRSPAPLPEVDSTPR